MPHSNQLQVTNGDLAYTPTVMTETATTHATPAARLPPTEPHACFYNDHRPRAVLVSRSAHRDRSRDHHRQSIPTASCPIAATTFAKVTDTGVTGNFGTNFGTRFESDTTHQPACCWSDRPEPSVGATQELGGFGTAPLASPRGTARTTSATPWHDNSVQAAVGCLPTLLSTRRDQFIEQHPAHIYRR